MPTEDLAHPKGPRCPLCEIYGGRHIQPFTYSGLLGFAICKDHAKEHSRQLQQKRDPRGDR